MSLAADLRTAIDQAVIHQGGPRGAGLEAPRLVQAAEGGVSDTRLPEVAETLSLTTAEPDSIATFYSLIFRRPVGQTEILLCDGASCWMNGTEAVRHALQDGSGITNCHALISWSVRGKSTEHLVDLSHVPHPG
jgi:NADH-quinone oxidoreductase subunit E